MPSLFQKIYRFLKYLLFRLTHPHLDAAFIKIYAQSKNNTLTSGKRMLALYESIAAITENNVEGDVVECGVYQGGSSMLTALTLKQFKDTSRSIYLYDTFEGMTEPTEKDISYKGERASTKWQKVKTEEGSDWCLATLDHVKQNMQSTQYPIDKCVFVKGKVEETLPKIIPEKIAILRLDTDWYESTYHELEHLYPRLSKNGILIIDDYGYWQGAREAVDQYFQENNINLALEKIDYTGRLVIKKQS